MASASAWISTPTLDSIIPSMFALEAARAAQTPLPFKGLQLQLLPFMYHQHGSFTEVQIMPSAITTD